MCRSHATCLPKSSRNWPCSRGRLVSRRCRAGRSCAPATMPTKWLPAMRSPILMPDVGVHAPALSLWFAHPGDRVYAGDRVVELLLDGATFDVSAPATGRLAEKTARPGDRLTT